MQARMFKRTAIAIALAGVFAVGVMTADKVALHSAQAASTTTAAPAGVASNGPIVALPDFSALVDQYGPAVVNISVSSDGTKAAARQDAMPQIPEELAPFFRGMPRQQPGPMRGQGSGFIIDPDGIIMTNAHVVDGADEVTVKLVDKREFTAKVLGSDKTTDVAVLKIDAKNLPTVKIGNPETTRVGEWVVAIGTPFGLENTVTSGIVSAKSRSLPDDSYVPFIQTDAAINPGNSGGPLFNLKGEVIGINSQIFSRSGGSQGLGFAVPIDIAMQVGDQIQHTGKVTHGRLGVTIQDVNQALAQNFGLKTPAGALVGSVQKDGPGAKIGIEPGDVILKFNGKTVSRSGELPPMVAGLKPGAAVTLDVWRNGAEKQLSGTVGTLDDKNEVASADKAELGKARLGVAVRPLSPEEKRSSELSNGVVVEDVGGAAARAGVRSGDVILSINNTPVKSVEHLKELVAKSGKTVALLVQRDDARIFIPVTLG
jgi:serine protease Do